MRVITDGSKGLIKRKTEDSVSPSEHPPEEVKATCTNCLSDIGFTLLDDGVTLDNERDYNLECPQCGIGLSVGAVTGIVTQRNIGD
jgi:hypothetical protein